MVTGEFDSFVLDRGFRSGKREHLKRGDGFRFRRARRGHRREKNRKGEQGKFCESVHPKSF
jgi:hypothetical protein